VVVETPWANISSDADSTIRARVAAPRLVSLREPDGRLFSVTAKAYPVEIAETGSRARANPARPPGLEPLQAWTLSSNAATRISSTQARETRPRQAVGAIQAIAITRELYHEVQFDSAPDRPPRDAADLKRPTKCLKRQAAPQHQCWHQAVGK